MIFSWILKGFCPFLYFFGLLLIGFTSANPDLKVEEYFRSFSKKATPLFLCNNRHEGMKYRLPKQFNCPTPPNPRESTVVTATLYWEDISKQVIKGHQCFGTSETITHYTNFWNTDSEVIEKGPIHISETNCNEMVKNLRTPKGNKLNRIREGLWGTEFNTRPDYSYLRTRVASNENFFVEEVSMTVNSLDETIQTFIPIIENCKASSGYCSTMEGVLVWKPSTKTSCKLKLGKTVKCLQTGTQIMSCPQINMAFTNLTRVEMCGAAIGHTDQGVYFTCSEKLDIGEGIYETDRAVLKLGLQKEARRKRRDTNLITDSEANARFAYLYDLIKDGHNYNILLFHAQICQAGQITQNSLLYQVESGSPTILARAYLNNDRAIRARLLGDIVGLYRCEEVWNYYFVDNSNCTLEAKVKFMSGLQEHDGYVTPQSHEIVFQPTPVACPSPSFYFDLGEEGVILLANASFQVNIPHFPTPGEGEQGVSLPDITFNQPGVYSIEEVTNQGTLYSMMKQMANTVYAARVLAKHKSGMPLTKSESEFFANLQDISFAPMLTQLKYFIVFIIIIALCILFLITYIYFRPIIDGFRQFGRFIVAAWTSAKTTAESIYGAIMPKEPQPANSIEMTNNAVVHMEPPAPVNVHGVNISRPPALPRRNSRYEECDLVYTPVLEPTPAAHTQIYPLESLNQMRMHMDRPTAPPPYSQ